MANEDSTLNAIASSVFEKVSQAEISEMYITRKKTRSFEVRGQKIDTINIATEIGMALRVEQNGRIGFAYSSDISEESLDLLAASAIISMQESETTQDAGIKTDISSHNPQDMEIMDERVKSISDEEIIESTLSMESSALSHDPRIKRVRNTITSLSSKTVLLANSLGKSATYSSSKGSASLQVVAESASEAQIGAKFDIQRFFNDLDFTSLGRQAAQYAISLLGAKKVKSANIPVIFSEEIAADMLTILASSLNGENVLRGKSMFAGKTGSQVTSSLISIIDDGIARRKTGSSPFDDEGELTGKTELIENGILKGYLHNRTSAKKMAEKPTGNGFRSNFKSTPAVSPSNLYIKPGSSSEKDILKDVPSGFYVKEAMGLHTANPVSGDFSIGATGHWITNGDAVYPVREVILAGNIKELFQNIVKVGNKIHFFGGTGAPVLLVESLSLSGN